MTKEAKITMMGRLPELLDEFAEREGGLRERAADPVRNRSGCFSLAVADSCRFLGVARYVLHGNINEFRSQLGEAVHLQLRLFERFDAGEPIDRSYVSMLVYKSLFDALAAGAFDVAEALAQRMGGRPELEKQFDHPFDYALGYALKWFVLGERQQMTEWCAKFADQCEKRGNKNFQGYAKVFQAILADDRTAANDGLRQIVEGHVKESKRGVFRDNVDEVLCVWGLGMANLCRRRGLTVDAVPPLIPADLLVPVGGG